MAKSIEWVTYSQVFAFLGNSLLSPMKQTSDADMDPAFWASFPDFGDDAVASACKRCGGCKWNCRARREGGAYRLGAAVSVRALPSPRGRGGGLSLPRGDEAVRAFAESHPLGWIEALRRAVRESHPQGCIDGILGVAEASLASLSADLR